MQFLSWAGLAKEVIMNIEFDENAYRNYAENRKYPLNTPRIRPDGEVFVDVLVEGRKIMESTRRGRETLAYIDSLGKTNG
jgi:hypothetical protein